MYPTSSTFSLLRRQPFQFMSSLCWPKATTWELRSDWRSPGPAVSREILCFLESTAIISYRPTAPSNGPDFSAPLQRIPEPLISQSLIKPQPPPLFWRQKVANSCSEKLNQLNSLSNTKKKQRKLSVSDHRVSVCLIDWLFVDMAGKGKGEGPAIGIDLGTTYSCVGVWRHDRVEIIPNDQGNRTTPSYVAFTDTERLIGDAAKNQVAMNPTNTVFGMLYIIFIFKFCGI